MREATQISQDFSNSRRKHTVQSLMAVIGHVSFFDSLLTTWKRCSMMSVLFSIFSCRPGP